MTIEHEKDLAASAAAALVTAEMRVGLGTGSTVAYLLSALALRHLDIACVATSPVTEALAMGHGLRVVGFDQFDRLDLTIDGADQVDPAGWLVKGGGGAHTREKIVAAAADRFVVIVSSNKLVGQLRPPIPLELAAFGLPAILRRVPEITVRAEAPRTPDGGVLADYGGAVGNPADLAEWLSSLSGVVSHGLFPATMVDRVLVGRGEQVEVLVIAQ